ncbi:MAG TPA: hypothetical protein VFM79_01120 [Pelobium sp.]|nr:hypothetical protein [Pelobium sp.]
MKKQLLILALAGLAFTACEKDDAPNPQLLKKITEIDNGDTTTTNFSYDNNRRVSLIKSSDGTETKLSYFGNNLTTVENKMDSDNKTKLEITYDGAKPKTAVYTIYEDNELIEKYKYSYTLNSSNQIAEILVKDSTNTNVISKQVITYANSNISKIQSYLGTTLVSTQELTYGNKKSIFSNARASYVVDVFLADLYAVNEVVKLKYTLADVSREITNTYIYDENGFPTSANVSEKELPSGTPETSKLKFDY